MLAARDGLRDAAHAPWNADAGFVVEQVLSSPLGRLVLALDAARLESAKSLDLLCLFAARRALACWELYCDGRGPHDAVSEGERWILEDQAPSADRSRHLARPAPPAYRGVPIADCRACDTGCAASAAAELIAFLATRELRRAVHCLSAADMAFDQSPLIHEDRFRDWLLDVAIPVAWEGRDMTPAERDALRRYDPGTLAGIRDEKAGRR